MQIDGAVRLTVLVGLAGAMPAAAASSIDPADAAAIDQPAAVAALERMARAGKIRWQPSAVVRAVGGEILDWEGGGVVSSAAPGPVDHYRPSPEAQQRGYELFAWNYMVRMIPASRPRSEAIGGALSLAAAPGEYEPAAFGVLALEDLQNVRAAVGRLRSESGAVLPASALELRWVRYIPRLLKRRARPELWSLGPAVLAAMKPTNIPAGCARQGWLTVKVPQDARAGLYRGFVQVQADGRPSARLELLVRVRPIRLGSADPVVYAHYYNVPPDDARMLLEMTAAREHGCNSLTPVGILHGRARADRDGHILSVDFSRADRFMEAFRQLGFRGPIPLFDLKVQGRGKLTDCTSELFLVKKDRHKIGSEAFFRAMREMVALVRDHARQENWPEVYMYSSSELSRWQDVEGELIPFGIRLIKEMKSVGGVKVCASINGPDEPRFVRYDGPGELAFLPLLDLVMYNYGVPINDRTIAEVAKHPGLLLWFQNIGTSRFTEGFMVWRAGAVGRRQYKLDGRLTEDGLLSSAGIFYRTADGILPTTDWQCMREGVDDMRYIRTLERAIEKAKKAGQERTAAFALQAERRLQEIKASINIDMSRASVRRGERPGLKRLELYDKYRQALAEMIERLSAPGDRLEAHVAPAAPERVRRSAGKS